MEYMYSIDFIDMISSHEDISLTEDIYVRDWCEYDDIISDYDYTYIVEKFSGIFDGNGHTVYNLPTQIFNEIGENGEVKDLKICLKNKILSKSILCETNKGLIQNVVIQNASLRSNASKFGGLVTENNGKIYDCCFNGELKISKIPNTNLHKKWGGIVGINTGLIENSKFQGFIKCKDMIGGICGKNDGTVKNNLCYKSKLLGETEVGGIVGKNNSKLTGSKTKNSRVRGNKNIGGVCGGNAETIKNCKTMNSIVGCKHNTYISGGICGTNDGLIEHVQISKDTVILGEINVGGLAGLNLLSISKSQIDETASVIGKRAVGGVCGYERDSSLKNIISSPTVRGKQKIGGLIGSCFGESHCENLIGEATITVEGEQVGALIGKSDYNCIFKNCYSLTKEEELIGYDVRKEEEEGVYYSDRTKEELLVSLSV